MGKIGKTYPHDALLNHDEAARRFDRLSLGQPEDGLRQEITAAIVGLLGMLALVGWALTL